MMNVPLIFHAAREAGDHDLYELAVGALPDDRADARPSRRLDGARGHLRPRHRRVPPASRPSRAFAPTRPGRAGWPGRSTGSRRSSRYTGDPADLDVARRNADCYLERCPGSLVPPWDFDAPDEAHRPEDSSAAAIAASGLLDLAAVCRSGDPDGAGRYRDAALTILDSLASDRYMAWAIARLGGRAEARRVPYPQEAGRGRVGHVGRVLLPRGGRQGVGLRRRAEPAGRRRARPAPPDLERRTVGLRTLGRSRRYEPDAPASGSQGRPGHPLAGASGSNEQRNRKALETA